MGDIEAQGFEFGGLFIAHGGLPDGGVIFIQPPLADQFFNIIQALADAKLILIRMCRHTLLKGLFARSVLAQADQLCRLFIHDVDRTRIYINHQGKPILSKSMNHMLLYTQCRPLHI